MFSSSYASSDMPPSAPPSSSSPTSPVRYFDRPPNEIIRIILDQVGPVRYVNIYAYRSRQADLRALCLVSRRLRSIVKPLLFDVVALTNHDSLANWQSRTANQRRSVRILVLAIEYSAPVDSYLHLPKETPHLTQLAVHGLVLSPCLATGTLTQLRFLQINLVPKFLGKALPRTLLPCLEALSCSFGISADLDLAKWPQFFPALRMLEIDSSTFADEGIRPLLDHVDVVQVALGSSLVREMLDADNRHYGTKVLPVASVRSDYSYDRLAADLVEWEGLPVSIRCTLDRGPNRFIRKLVYPGLAVEGRVRVRELDWDQSGFESVALEGVNVFFKIDPPSGAADPVSWAHLLRQRVRRRKIVEQLSGQVLEGNVEGLVGLSWILRNMSTS